MPSMPVAVVRICWHALTADVLRYGRIAHALFMLLSAACKLLTPDDASVRVVSLRMLWWHALTAADLCYALIALARSMLVAADSTLLTPDRAQHACGWYVHVVAYADGGRFALRSHHARTVCACRGRKYAACAQHA